MAATWLQHMMVCVAISTVAGIRSDIGKRYNPAMQMQAFSANVS